MTTANTETLGFQTEAKQLLQLMIHSLYSNKEIFLRELISNASDAADKLRFEALNNDALYEGQPALRIRIDYDAEANTVSIEDTGIGMSRDEVITNLGTIAKSGTADFLSNLSGDQAKDSQLIGQFGVGFYSAFIVADKVEVETRRAGSPAAEGVRWVSTGESDFTIEAVERADRGTRITLHLKADQTEFADSYRLKSIIKKYSDHIAIPVEMKEQAAPAEDDAPAPDAEYVAVNNATALWTRSRSEVSDEEYGEFYKHISHDFADPLVWSHNRVEGKLDYTSLLFIPAKAPFDLWNRDAARGLKLYVQRTFIMDEAEQFLPLYLRFVKGIVDSNDLSLNVSREILQQDAAVDSMKSALTKRVLDTLDKLAKKDADKYQGFWDEFGQVLKEGPAEDFANKERIAKLLRFATSTSADATQNVGLVSYSERMIEGQSSIYYLAADSFATAKASPHLEIFKKKGIEVLLLTDRVDEWMVSHLGEFDGKKLVDVARGELDLGEIESDDDKAATEQVNEANKDLIERIKGTLETRVSDVRATTRLTDSPACLVVGDNDMGMQMRRLLEQAGQEVPQDKPILELNVDHPLVSKLDSEADEERFADLASIIFDQAALAAGDQLESPSEYVSRLNKLLLGLID